MIHSNSGPQNPAQNAAKHSHFTHGLAFLPVFFCLMLAFVLPSGQIHASLSSGEASSENLINVTDLLNIKQMSNLSYSPDGRHLLFTVQSVTEQDDKDRPYRYQTHIWLARTDGSRPPRPLTTGDDNATQPAWHPGGRHIAFIRSTDGSAQIYLLSLDGGEPRQLTNHKGGASSPVWSPDGSRLLFSSSLSDTDLLSDENHAGGPDWPLEQDRRPLETRNTETKPDPDGDLQAIRAWLDANESNRNPRVINRLNFLGETDLQPRLSFSHRYVIDVDVQDYESPVSDGKALTSGWYSYGGGSWSADGNQIFVSSALDSTTHPDRVYESRIWRIPADGSRGATLVAAIPGYSAFNPIVSPDGRYLAFSTSDQSDRSYAQTEIRVLDLQSGSIRNLSASLDRSAGGVTWSMDSRHVYFTANSNGGTPLFRVAVTGGEVERLTPFDIGVRNFDVHRTQVAYVRTEITNPFEIYTAEIRTGRRIAGTDVLQNHSMLSRFNASWLEGKLLSRPERGVVTVDGFEVEYWIMKPTRYTDGETYPLMLQIHGGPSAMWGPGEASMWHEFQYFAAQGYGIVYSNPRGSGGYGRDFQFGNNRDWGFGPAADVLAATDIASALPWADENRLVITGGSYAGYLTAFIITQDHRFRAAFAQRGVYDLATFLGEGNAWRLVPNHFGGFPWDSAEVDSVLRANSPMTYVDQIQTPLLIKHGDLDLRTGVIQSEMLYKALKIREQPVEYVRYPRAAHDMSRTGEPLQRIDRILRIHEYFQRYLD